MTRRLLLAVALVLPSACAPDAPASSVGTPEQRAALFDTILARSERREAFSPVKNQALGVDPLASMRALRDTVIGAESEEDLFYALSRLSNARKDRHLNVALVPGGLSLPDAHGVPHADEALDEDPSQAPVRVLPDYGTPDRVDFFISDLPVDLSVFDGVVPGLGDRILAVNGTPVQDYLASVEPFQRYSALPNFWWRVAMALPERTALLPASHYGPRLDLDLERRDGSVVSVSPPYLPAGTVRWQGAADPRYPGFQLEQRTATYDLYLPEPGGPRAVVLRWYGFRETIIEDVDALMEYAATHELPDHGVIVDGTRSRGGSKRAYALQRLTPRPFRVTFGNLRLSDVTLPFIEAKRTAAAGAGILDSGVSETMDDGSWLILFLGPQGGSHLDQFAAQVIDNGLGVSLGMPAGGYSNTWEWEEVLTLPGSERPLVRFMYDIGHTLRPSGEILEGRAAPVQEFIPLTRDNFQNYYGMLLERALAVLQGRPVA